MSKAVEISNFYWRFPTFTGIKKEYSLRNINLDINRGELFGITGSTGSGKTTLCYVIAGLIPHQLKIPENQEEDHFRGKVSILGETIAELSESGNKKIIKVKNIEPGKIGLVRQDPETQLEDLTVIEELEISLKKLGLSEEEIRGRIKDALEIVRMDQVLENPGKVHPSELSSGEKQRLEIARFLALKPDILILDEPMSDLDPVGKSEMIDAINEMKTKSKITIIMVEQDPEILTRLVDRLAVMHRGEIVAVDKPENIYSRSEIKKILEIPELMELIGPTGEMDNRFVAEKVKNFRVTRAEKEKGKEILVINNLNFSYEDGTKAINNLALKIFAGEFVSLIGQNGSGKSTLSKIISGNLTGWSGEIKLDGEDIRYARSRNNFRRRVGYVFQNPDQQVLNGTVKDEMYSSLLKTHFSHADYEHLMTEVLKRVYLFDKINENINSLSRGEKRRLALASVLIMEPELLIIDEPAAGQDYRMSSEIMDMLSELNNDGVTVIIITHDMRLVAEYTRRGIVMKDGSIIFDGTPEELFQNDRIMEESSLAPPQLVRISRKLKDSGILNDILLNAKEWLDLFRFESEKKNYVALKFEDLKKYANELSAKILNKFGRPESIVYIERGGMVIGRLLSDYLSVRELYPLKASYYTDDGIPMTHVHIGGFERSLLDREGYILLVDDIADTGKTLEAALRVLREKTTRRIVTATVAYKPQSVIKPDVHVYTVDNDTWIVFDYEEIETISRFIRKNNEEGLTFMEKNFGFRRNR
jgi:energy-coupling factor transporter ATP-binding protein EcfA2/hypoxanthine phosphoribosyltransferase